MRFVKMIQGIPEKATKSLRVASFLPQHLVLQAEIGSPVASINKEKHLLLYLSKTQFNFHAF